MVELCLSDSATLTIIPGYTRLRSGAIKLRNTLTYTERTKKDPLSGKWNLLEVDSSSLAIKKYVALLFFDNNTNPSSIIFFFNNF